MVLRQPVQSRLELPGREPLDGFRGNDECRRARLAAMGERQLRSNGRGTFAVQEEIPRNPKKPRPACRRLAEFPPRPERPLERRLNQIVRVRPVVGPPLGKGSDLLQVRKRQITEFISGQTTSLLPQTAEQASKFHLTPTCGACLAVNVLRKPKGIPRPAFGIGLRRRAMDVQKTTHLQERLDAHRSRFEAKADPAVLQVMHRATEELEHSGIRDRVVRVGDLAPEFQLPDPSGRVVRLRDALNRGPVVLSFYRGHW